jgi:small acid-soluble spore protein O
MSKKRNNYAGSSMAASKEQGKAAGFNEEIAQEKLSEEVKQFNKKRKTNQ